MPSTNGHGPKRAILYARVSTDEQARSGYSLAQQLEALREYAAREGYEVLEEVVDPGQSGASLERPGMDRVRDLVAAGSVSVVLAQDRDRFAREPAYHYLLRREFEEHGTKIRAMNDRGDDSPEGELTDGILDQLSKFERAKTAERSRRGKLRKAREGKILRGPKPPYGFRYNTTGDGLMVYEPEMVVADRIFRLAAEGLGPQAIQTRLHDEGTPSPTGDPLWPRRTLEQILRSDLYKAHTFKEIAELVSKAHNGALYLGAGREWGEALQGSYHHPYPSQGRTHGGAGPGPPSTRVGGSGMRGSGGEQSAGAKAPSTDLGAAWAAALLVRLDYDHPHCYVTWQRR
jgi:DNA invertase Pin-like site-specific DNA recombinase